MIFLSKSKNNAWPLPPPLKEKKIDLHWPSTNSCSAGNFYWSNLKGVLTKASSISVAKLPETKKRYWKIKRCNMPYLEVRSSSQYDSCIDAADPLYMLHSEKIWIMVWNVKWLIGPLIFSTTSPSHPSHIHFLFFTHLLDRTEQMCYSTLALRWHKFTAIIRVVLKECLFQHKQVVSA